MVPIKKQMCPTNKYDIKCPYTRTPTRIVIHNTANDAPAGNEIAYMNNNDNEVSYHFAVDDTMIVQGLPLDRNAWASGDGHGKGNMEGIHIEICYSLSGGPKFTAAEKNAAEFTAYLLKQYGWGINKVTKHQDYDGKYCPHRTLDLGWQRFINMVKSYMTKNEEDIEMTMTKNELKAFIKTTMQEVEAETAKRNASKWAEPALDFVKERKIMVGDADGKMRPQSNITRQEVAQVIYNAFTKTS